MTAAIIKRVIRYTKGDQLTTVFFAYDLLNGKGEQVETFEFNNYEMFWFWDAMGMDKRFCPFADFWNDSTELERYSFLYLLVTDEKNSVISQSIKSKLRGQLKRA